MRKIFTVVCAVLLSGLVLTSFSPSLDGRAVVADDGVMPQGVFAKTVGYLPGDSISVTNLAKKTNVDILVIGALDPSEGVAILLSPEAASLLGIERGGNNVVKITKRSGQLDETVNGTAVIGDAPVTVETDAEEPETEPAEEIPESYAEETGDKEPEAELAEETDEPAAEAETPSEAVPEYVLVPEDEIPPEEEAAKAADEEAEPVEESVIPDDIAENTADLEECEPEPVEENSLPEESADVSEETADSEESEPEPVDSDEFSEEDIVPSEEYTEDDLLYNTEPETDEPQLEEKVEEEDIVALEPYDEEQPETECAEPEEGALEPESSSLEEALPIAEPTESRGETPADEAEEETEEYEAIVLVPSEPNPPLESESAEAPAEENAAPIESTPVIADDFARYTVPSLKDLESGKYYIQIGVYSEKANIRSVLDSYAENYPIVLVPLSNGKGTQIMVGPLTVDEYGTVLNRFKSYGFKDAFLRKIR